MFRGFLQPLLLLLTTSSTEKNVSTIGDVTDSVTDLSEAISNYGVAVVIMAVFFVIFIILIILLLRSNAKMMDQIISNNNTNNQLDQKIINKFVDNALDAKGLGSDSTTIIQTLSNELKESIQPLEKRINELNGDNKNNDYHKDLVGAYIDINMAFKDISRVTLTNLACDRVGIYIFHNGNKSMHGLPFFKMSCIHEWTSYGNSTLRGKSHMDMPLHLFNDFIENLYQSGVYKAENIENAIYLDPSIKEFVAFSNTKALYLVAIKDNENTLTGFVAAEFSEIDTFEHDRDRDEYVRNIIDNMVSKVAPIVGNKYIYRGMMNSN